MASLPLTRPLGTMLLLAAALSGCSRAPEAPQGPDPTELALRASANGAAELSFYNAAAWEPAWTAETVAQLKQAIAARAAHALDRVDFDTGEPAAGMTPVEADVERTRAALAYAAALARGASDPTKLYAIYTVPRPNPDLGAGLAAALKEKRVGAWLESLAPQDQAYRALAAAYRDGAASARAAIPPLAVPIGVDMEDPRVPAIARQLTAYGYLAPDPAAARAAVLTPAMADAVRQLQEDYGQTDDGIVRASTLDILNVAPTDKRRSIAVAMERLRWLEREPPRTRIDVNVAAARLTYWRDGAIADQRNVVVGAPKTKTPQLGSPIFRLVANPTWTIPQSIIRNDNMMARSGRSLARSGMRRVGKRIVQQPGPRNSLGLVKFDMRNPYAIYLHDTPAKGLFSAAKRHRSHGCVRVKDALGFAELVATDQGVLEQYDRARPTGKTAGIPLKSEIPVRLIYATVLLSAGGQPVVRDDPYDWDPPVARALGFSSKAEPVLATKAVDAGP